LQQIAESIITKEKMSTFTERQWWIKFQIFLLNWIGISSSIRHRLDRVHQVIIRYFVTFHSSSFQWTNHFQFDVRCDLMVYVLRSDGSSENKPAKHLNNSIHH
jgi:hypothetical protein